MQYLPAEPLLSRLASPPRCKGREKLTDRHTCCVAAALGEALPINNISTGKIYAVDQRLFYHLFVTSIVSILPSKIYFLRYRLV